MGYLASSFDFVMVPPARFEHAAYGLGMIWPQRFEDGVLDAAIWGTLRLAHFGVEGPWLVMVMITGIKNYLFRLTEDIVRRLHGGARLRFPLW